jgi:hypothetical protein
MKAMDGMVVFVALATGVGIALVLVVLFVIGITS